MAFQCDSLNYQYFLGPLYVLYNSYIASSVSHYQYRALEWHLNAPEHFSSCSERQKQCFIQLFVNTEAEVINHGASS